jgi:uncharacterized membrane protein YphA (DoxX/SURF4 family)
MANVADSRRGTMPLPTMSIAKGLAAFRIFMGLLFGLNGIAKVINKGAYDLGIASFGLINRDIARGLLTAYAGPKSHAIAPLKWFYNNLVLDHWAPWSVFLTVAELAIGVSLCFGIASRLGPLIGLALIFPLQIMVADNMTYLWEFPVDWVPMVILALVPSGRVWGYDRRLVERFGDRWPL